MHQSVVVQIFTQKWKSKQYMETELSFLLGLASCRLLENSIKRFSSMEYTDDAMDKSDLSVHLTTGEKKKIFWLTAENC